MLRQKAMDFQYDFDNFFLFERSPEIKLAIDALGIYQIGENFVAHYQ